MNPILDDRKLESQEMRAAYINTLIEMAERDSRVLTLDADLRMALTLDFAKKFPSRAIECGIQEANMIGVAAGLSATGMVPFAQSFTPCVIRRAYETICVSAAYGKLNVKLMGFDQGVLAAYNGGTHMSFDDIGLIRMIPDTMVFDIADSTMLKDILWQIKDIYGVQYVRFPRDQMKRLYKKETRFEIGKGLVIHDGTDATIITSGIQVDEALNAAEALNKIGISVRIVDMFTIKPLDTALVQTCAEQTGAIVTAENHGIVGGLGSAVAETLLESAPVPMERIGVQNEFGEVGSVDYLMNRFCLDAPHIVEAVKKVVAKKHNYNPVRR